MALHVVVVLSWHPYLSFFHAEKMAGKLFLCFCSEAVGAGVSSSVGVSSSSVGADE